MRSSSPTAAPFFVFMCEPRSGSRRRRASCASARGRRPLTEATRVPSPSAPEPGDSPGFRATAAAAGVRVPNRRSEPERRSVRLLVEAELLEAAVEGLRRDLEELHGATLVALRVLERAHDLAALQLLDGLL